MGGVLRRAWGSPQGVYKKRSWPNEGLRSGYLYYRPRTTPTKPRRPRPSLRGYLGPGWVENPGPARPRLTAGGTAPLPLMRTLLSEPEPRKPVVLGRALDQAKPGRPEA